MGTFLENCEIVRAVDVHAIVHWGQKLAAFNAVVRRVLLPRKIGVLRVRALVDFLIDKNGTK